jgi:hypothetical protein
VAIDAHCHDHIVGHAALETHAGNAKTGGKLLAGIDDDHFVVGPDHDGGHVLRELARSHHQPPAGSVDGPHDAAVETVPVLPGRLFQGRRAGPHVEHACAKLLGGDAIAQFAQDRDLRARLEDQPQGAAATPETEPTS